jgi:multiple sugar transport system substrate-binding protein
MRITRRATIGTALAVALPHATSAQSPVTLRVWSHWAADPSRRDFVERLGRDYEAANPGLRMEFTWYDKPALNTALRTALRARQAADIFYAEPDQTEYIDNNFLADLSAGVDWTNVEPWAKTLWSRGNGVYGVPLEAWTVELFYRPDLMERIGARVSPGDQLSREAFLDLVRKSRAAGVTPISLGVGDRPYPGAFLATETLVKLLGPDDYGKLLAGQFSWTDPRVLRGLSFVRELADAGALPANFTTMRLSESTTGFHRNPGALMLLMGSFYLAGTFRTPEQGGAGDVRFHMMRWPALDGSVAREAKTLSVGGSYVVNAASRNRDLAIGFLRAMAQPEVGRRWMELNAMQSGIRTSPEGIGGRRGEVLRELMAVNAEASYAFGIPAQVMAPRPREAFQQVINQALPAGLLTPEEAAARMSRAF